MLLIEICSGCEFYGYVKSRKSKKRGKSGFVLEFNLKRFMRNCYLLL